MCSKEHMFVCVLICVLFLRVCLKVCCFAYVYVWLIFGLVEAGTKLLELSVCSVCNLNQTKC